MNITITEPDVADVDTMVSWGTKYRELWAGENMGWYAPETLRDWIANPKQDVIIVARDGTKLVGMCLVHSLRDWAYCGSLFVLSGYRGKGVGKSLLTAAMEKIKKQGIKYFSLLVEEQNRNAQKFYSSLGFRKGFTHHWMEKEL